MPAAALNNVLPAGWMVAALTALAFLALIAAAVQGRGRRAAATELTRAQVEAAAMAARLDSQAARVTELTEERDNLTDALHEARQAAATLEREVSALQLTARRDAEASAREIALLREMRDEMSAQFRLLADDSLRRQGADLEKMHSERLAALLTPFREQVQQFQQELADRNRAAADDRAALREQIEGLHRRSEEIGRDAVALARALKGDKQRQGAWGEMVLDTILDQSGLQDGVHYVAQTSQVDAQGRRWRPDVIIRMPRDRVLVIDSKVSLVDYAEASACDDDPVRRDLLLRRHAAAMRRHVTELANRGYQALDDGSVDYVLMFVPIEGALSYAMRSDPDLATFALDRRVGLATPTTLMLTLRTVEHVWAVERRETNAAEIASRAGALYDKLAGFVDAMEDAGRALDTASRAHETAMARLTRGPGNVIRQAELLRELGARTQKRLALDHDRADVLPLGRAERGPG